MLPRAVRPRTAPFVCWRCLHRRAYSSSTDEDQAYPSVPPPPPPPSGAVKLTNRRLISLYGPDATQFLHGLTTATLHPGQTAGIYSAFLNAQGRMLNDVFIYPAAHSADYTAYITSLTRPVADPTAYLIEVDAAEANSLLAHLKRYKLRAKFDMRLLPAADWAAWSVWDDSEPWTPHPPSASQAPAPPSDTPIGCIDSRAPGMGRRLVLPSAAAPPPDATPAPLPAYTLRRMLRGVPEGQAELPREASLPQESDVDFMGGIDFRKGCYVGQELTIRTHHTGVVRKRVLPALLYPSGAAQPERLAYDEGAAAEMQARMPPPGTNIVPVGKRGRSAGRWLRGVGNVGLALCRIEMMTDMVLTGEGSRWTAQDEFRPKEEDGEGEEGGVKVKAFVPDWVRSKTKVKNANRQV